MSDTLTPSGLQSSAGLYGQCGVYQFDRNGAIFNPLDLNPYLLFDAESSMIGTLENPTLDLDPTKQESLDVITATRAGTATFTDVNGLIASAPANTVRVDHVDGVPMILVEPSSENFLLYSEDFSQSPWIKNGTSSVSSNTTISPDGTLNASTISNATGTSTSDTVFLSINPADVDHTFSVYVKSAGATTMSLFMRSGVTGVILSQAISLTDEWQRVTLTHNIQNGQLILGNSDGDFHVWGAQLETGSVATSYIPTSGSTVTRAADDLVISGSDFDFYNNSEGTIYCEFVPTQASAGRYVWSINNGTYSSRTFQNILSNLQLTNTYRINNSDSFLQTIATHNVSPNEINRTAFTYSSDLFQSSIDGNNSSSNSGATTSAFNKLNLGATAVSSDINTYALTGHVKRLIYWPYSSDRL